ncbi:MAG: rod shape-determining protein MreD [Paracoccaceae bacterium]
MVETSPSRIWTMRALYLALSLGIMFFQLMPLDVRPHDWAGPDLLLILPMAWALRRAEYVPALLVGAIMLLADLLFMRPPGLMAFLVVIAVEFLKMRALHMREQTLIAEWFNVALVLVAVILANRFVLLLLMVAQPPLGLTLIQLGATVLAYPVIMAVTHFVFGVRKAQPGEVDALGHRL